MGITATVVAVAGAAAAGYGAYESAQAAKQQNSAQQQLIAQQQQEEAVRRQQMELESRRQSLEQVRQMQRARALGVATATGQGALFGSGIQGAFGQISGQGGTNLLGIQQNTMAGEQMFDINAAEAGSKIQLANAQTRGAIGGAITSFGGALMASSSTIGNIGGNLFAPPQLSSTDFGTGRGQWPMYIRGGYLR